MEQSSKLEFKMKWRSGNERQLIILHSVNRRKVNECYLGAMKDS